MTRKFYFEQYWNLEDLTGYINTWSGVQHFFNHKGFNPVEVLKDDIKKIWPSQDSISFRFPLFVRIGKIRHP